MKYKFLLFVGFLKQYQKGNPKCDIVHLIPSPCHGSSLMKQIQPFCRPTSFFMKQTQKQSLEYEYRYQVPLSLSTCRRVVQGLRVNIKIHICSNSTVGLSSSSVPHLRIQPTLDNLLRSWVAWIVDTQDQLYIFGKKRTIMDQHSANCVFQRSTVVAQEESEIRMFMASGFKSRSS